MLSIIFVKSTANAQITIKRETNPLKKVATIDPYWQWLYTCEDEEAGFRFLFSMKSDNRFDDSTYMISLGSTKEEALESVDALMSLLSMGTDESATIRDWTGVDLKIYKCGANGLAFYSTKQKIAGQGHTYKSYLKILRRVIENYGKEVEDTEDYHNYDG